MNPNGASPDSASPDSASPDSASPNSASPNTASPDSASPRRGRPTTRAFPAARRQTYAFLRDAAATRHVYLTTDVDASALVKARAESGGRIGFTSFVVKAAAGVVAAHPECRTVIRDGLFPRVATVPGLYAKVLFDKTVDGTRCVVAGSVDDPDTRSVEDIQAAVDTLKAAPVEGDGPFRAVRMIQRLPVPLGGLLYRAALRSPGRRAALQGTFSVTSVGHRGVRSILPMIGGVLGFGVGRAEERALVREGRLVVAPVLTLSLVFDHRVLDGALAADVLADVRDRLEGWSST